MIPPTFDGMTTLTVRRTFPATRERVFRAWTERAALLQWFRPDGKGVIISELDVRVGGSFRFDFADGCDSLVGTYLEVVRPAKLVFTWSSAATHDEETVVTVEFIEDGSATQVVLTHERLSGKGMCSLHQSGWQSLLDQLGSSLSPHAQG